MKAQENNNNNQTIVCFEIGRGGRFNNSGHLSYLPYKKPSELISYYDNSKGGLFVNPENYYDVLSKLGDRPNLVEKLQKCSENENYEFFEKLGFNMGEDYYFDSNGRPVVSVEDADSGIFRINWDNDYDSCYTCYIDDCDEKELWLILNADRDNTDEAKQLLIKNFDRTDLIEENESEEA